MLGFPELAFLWLLLAVPTAIGAALKKRKSKPIRGVLRIAVYLTVLSGVLVLLTFPDYLKSLP